ncbi:MAG: hypothetical protein CMD25_04750 [Flavobacteriales bacterium]|nr:hypothetical protein [Flavobacteriales bacterium]
MATVITFKKSSTQNAVPTTSDITLGELAVNTYHGRFYTEKNDGSAAIVEVGSNPASFTINDAITFPTSDGTSDQVIVTDGSGTLSWADQSGGGSYGTGNTFTFTLSGTTTTISGNDDDGQALSYEIGKEAVYLNGVLLQDGGVDYATTSSSVITLQANGESGDVVCIKTPKNPVALETSSSALTTTNADQTILSVASAGAKATKVSLTAVHSTGSHSCEIVMGNDGSNAFFSQFGDVTTTGAFLYTVSTTMSSGNQLLRVTPANTNTTFFLTYSRLPATKDGELTTTTTSEQTLDSQSTAYEGLKYSLLAVHSSGTHACEVVVGTDGSNAFYSQYGDVITASSLFSLNTSVSSGNTNLLVTPANTNTTFYWDVTKRGE